MFLKILFLINIILLICMASYIIYTIIIYYLNCRLSTVFLWVFILSFILMLTFVFRTPTFTTCSTAVRGGGWVRVASARVVEIETFVYFTTMRLYRCIIVYSELLVSTEYLLYIMWNISLKFSIPNSTINNILKDY